MRGEPRPEVAVKSGMAFGAEAFGAKAPFAFKVSCVPQCMSMRVRMSLCVFAA